MEGIPGGLEGLLAGGLDGIWDNPMVANIAFHPSPAEPKYMDATSGPIRDGTFDVSDGMKVAYRLYLPPPSAEVKAVVFFFHGNAEVCTNMDDAADMFHSFGSAVLSIDYRGYAWGTGNPSLTKLCADADLCFAAAERVLGEAGCGQAKIVMHGRSIGATCAVHLASQHSGKVHGLIVDSGLMSVKTLPAAQMMAMMLFQGNPGMFQMVPEPFDTYGKLSAVACPTLVMHGDQDEIVPHDQAVKCHEKCRAPDKKLVTWPGGGHNNIGLMYAAQYGTEVQELLAKAFEYSNPFPSGILVEAHSLSAAALNGVQGRVIGPQADRIRVSFPDPHGEKALKPTNLKVIEEAPSKGVNDFPIGAEVEAHSLSSADLNGIKGRVLGPQADRVRVEFPAPHGEKALKPSNLAIVE